MGISYGAWYLGGWNAASKLWQVNLPHIAYVFWMRHYKPLDHSIWCLCMVNPMYMPGEVKIKHMG